MRYDTVNDLFLFVLGHVENVSGLVELCLAAVFALLALQDLINADALIAARVLILGPIRVRRHLDLRRLLMEPTEAHLCDRIVLHATVTFDEVEVGPYLPVDFFPRDAVGFSHESHKLLQVPVLVDHVLGTALSVVVNKASSLAAGEYLALLLGE